MVQENIPSILSRNETPIAILGMGHVGLPTALGLAELGWNVIGADNDPVKIEMLQRGECPFYEPGMQELLQKHIATKRLQVTSCVDDAIRLAQILFICVWTSQKENGEADLTHIEAVAQIIARNLNGYKLIIEKSTVPAGTGQCIRKTIERYLRAEGRRHTNGNGNGRHSSGTDLIEGVTEESDFDIVSNPEFLQEGRALENILRPDRIVCGTDSDRAELIIRELYSPYNCPVIVTDLNTSELIKHAANAFLATKISFINTVADLCEAVGADIAQVAQGIGLDPRIGPGFLNAGIGFGGYCLPKDLRALVYLGEKHSVDLSLLKEVENINRQRIDLFLGKIRESLWIVKGKTIGILGLAFKPGTDDIREAPSSAIIDALLRDGAILQLYDPQAIPNYRERYPEQPGRLSYCESPYDAARGAHALLLITEWDEFRRMDLPLLQGLMKDPVLLDGRNFIDPETARDAGFEYVSIGRGNSIRSRTLAPVMVGAF